MRGAEILRSGAFRFALALAAVFALGASALLIVVDRAIADYALEASATTLSNESAILAGEDRAAGRHDMLLALARHRGLQREQAFRYLLVDRAGRRITGDLPEAAARSGWATVTVADRRDDGGAAETDVLKTLGVRLGDGALLVVGTDTYDVAALRARLDRFAWACGAAITVGALIAGYLVAMLFMRRLDRVNTVVARIMAGRMTERLPPIGMAPELDRLSANLNRMLDRIETLMAELRQVTTDIAHDLRTPLTRLRQGLEGLSHASSFADYAVGVEAAIAQTDEILAIFRALLRIGTLESGAARARFTDVDLSELMERMALAYRPAAEDGGRMLTAMHAAGISVAGDPELIAQAVANLIENALAHTPVGTRVTMRLAMDGGQAMISVADDGPGIPAAERGNVLMRFYRLDASRHSPGAGLGLALVAAVAALHAATLAIDDNAPGTRVTIRFPARIAR